MSDYFERLFAQETLLTGFWSPSTGVVVQTSALPTTWNRALDRIGRDLLVRQFAGTLASIRFEANHDVHTDADGSDYVWLSSAVTPVGDINWGSGMGHSGAGVLPDADEESVAVSCAALVQDQIERAGIVWPRGRAGGIVSAVLVDGIATWSDRRAGESSPIGSLRP